MLTLVQPGVDPLVDLHQGTGHVQHPLEPHQHLLAALRLLEIPRRLVGQVTAQRLRGEPREDLPAPSHEGPCAGEHVGRPQLHLVLRSGRQRTAGRPLKARRHPARHDRQQVFGRAVAAALLPRSGQDFTHGFGVGPVQVTARFLGHGGHDVLQEAPRVLLDAHKDHLVVRRREPLRHRGPVRRPGRWLAGPRLVDVGRHVRNPECVVVVPALALEDLAGLVERVGQGLDRRGRQIPQGRRQVGRRAGEQPLEHRFRQPGRHLVHQLFAAGLAEPRAAHAPHSRR